MKWPFSKKGAKKDPMATEIRRVESMEAIEYRLAQRSGGDVLFGMDLSKPGGEKLGSVVCLSDPDVEDPNAIRMVRVPADADLGEPSEENFEQDTQMLLDAKTFSSGGEAMQQVKAGTILPSLHQDSRDAFLSMLAFWDHRNLCVGMGITDPTDLLPLVTGEYEKLRSMEQADRLSRLAAMTGAPVHAFAIKSYALGKFKA